MPEIVEENPTAYGPGTGKVPEPVRSEHEPCMTQNLSPHLLAFNWVASHPPLHSPKTRFCAH